MNTRLQQLWLSFKEELWQALAHHYNDEDEQEYIEPLHAEIMRTDGLDVCAMEKVIADMTAINKAGFDVWLTFHEFDTYGLMFSHGQEYHQDLEHVHRRLLRFIDEYGVLTDGPST